MTDEFGIESENASLAEHKLNGEVEHVVYESEDASYTVFRLRDPQGAVHTAVGTVPGLPPARRSGSPASGRCTRTTVGSSA